MKPNIPLTWMTRQLKEMVEKDDITSEADGIGDSGTLTRKPRKNRCDDSTLKRHHNIGTFHGLINNNSFRKDNCKIYFLKTHIKF